MKPYKHELWIHSERIVGLEARVKKIRDKFAEYDSAAIYQPRMSLCKDTPPRSVSSPEGHQMTVRVIIEGALPDNSDTDNKEFLLWAQRWKSSLENRAEWEAVQGVHYSKWEQWPTLLYIKLACEYIAAYGFNKTTEINSTRDALVDIIRGNKPHEQWGNLMKTWEVEPLPDPLFYKEVHTIINYFLTEEGKSPYLKKAKRLLSRPFFDAHDHEATGILASLPSVYSSRKSPKQSHSEVNEPFGEVKQRGPLKLHLKRAEEKTMRTYPIVTYIFRDDAGRRFIWNASWPGEESLVVGATYLLTGTVDSHSLFKNKHYTNLKRCAKFKECRPDAPQPNFKGGAKRRPFKPECSASWSIYNKNGLIDGRAYVVLKRLWKEDKKKKELVIHEPFPLKHHLSWFDFVSNSMTSQCKVIREQGLDPELDSELLDVIRPFQSLQEVLRKPNSSWYLVDDALGPTLDHRNAPYPNPPGDRSPPSQRIPKLFDSQYNARTYGRAMPCGRIMEVTLNNPVFTIVPPMVSVVDPNGWTQFKNMAIKNGVNILIHIDESHTIEYYEPFMWDRLASGNGYKHSSPEPVHKSFDKERKIFLQGRRFICLTGVEDDELAERIKDAWRQDVYANKLLNNNIKPDVSTQTNPSGATWVGQVPLCAVLESLVEPAPHRHYNLVVTDKVTCYYLKMYGASVIEVDIQKEGSENGLMFSWKKENIIALTEYVVAILYREKERH